MAEVVEIAKKKKKKKKVAVEETLKPKKYGLFDTYEEHLLAAISSYCYFIQYIIYPSNFHANSECWRIGNIYYEWEDLLQHPLVRVLAPRDFTKSFFFCEGYIVWRLWREDRYRVTILSKTDGVAKERLYNIKTLCERIPELNYMKTTAENWGAKELRLGNGSRVAVAGYRSNVRGEHSELILLDDPIDSQVIYSDEQNRYTKDRLLMEILPVAEPHTQILITGTVQREDDLYMALPKEFICKTYQAIVDEKKQLTLYPEKWPWEDLMRRRALYLHEEGSERYWEKEYMNNPKALQGAIFQEKWFRYIMREHLPPLTRLSLYIGCDLAVGKRPDSGCYTCIVVIGIDIETQLIYVLRVVRERLNFPERIAALRRVSEEYPDSLVCGIEDNVFQEDTVRAAAATMMVPVVGLTSRKNKLECAESMSVHFRNGRIHFVADGYDSETERPLLDKSMRDLRKELLNCPGASWDQIDAMDKALRVAKYSAPSIDENDYMALMASMQASARKSYDPLQDNLDKLFGTYPTYGEL